MYCLKMHQVSSCYTVVRLHCLNIRSIEVLNVSKAAESQDSEVLY